MKIFTTYYTDAEGIKWSGKRINAINWDDAEMQAQDLGLTVRGRLVEEKILDENNNIIQVINYENIQNN